jgi:hypothetical protein
MNCRIQVVSNHYVCDHLVLESIKYVGEVLVLQVSVENLVGLRREINSTSLKVRTGAGG